MFQFRQYVHLLFEWRIGGLAPRWTGRPEGGGAQSVSKICNYLGMTASQLEADRKEGSVEGARGSKEPMGEMCMLGKHVLAQSHRQEGKRKTRRPEVSEEPVVARYLKNAERFCVFFLSS